MSDRDRTDPRWLLHEVDELNATARVLRNQGWTVWFSVGGHDEGEELSVRMEVYLHPPQPPR